ncbi:cytidylyltransferase domain-containing protein [Saccharibacillus alkalitolerans]|uniref:NTP transferase domain-containing protein n=1 Tax=Saccharibacillus alkalitolerans TaxID=2705290 RepID=A0ABX0F588_9BACL|nr:NTP transferase domain-containing protein [Saccharibacillus alkalitolerans]NGZ76111.1 NTP transferase domain-containing protein [Saccharibacillus alkalitolerans]
MVKKVAIIQARLSSSRLPAKVLKSLDGKTLIERVVEKTKQAQRLDEIWIATSTREEDDLLEMESSRLGVFCFRGSLENVLDRFYHAAVSSDADWVVRITADNPLTEPRFIDSGLDYAEKQGVDHVRFEPVPYGSGIEVIRRSALEKAFFHAQSDYEKEHVTPYILNNPAFNKAVLQPKQQELRRSDIIVTIDTFEQYVQSYKMFRHFNGAEVTLEQAIHYYEGLHRT